MTPAIIFIAYEYPGFVRYYWKYNKKEKTSACRQRSVVSL